MKHGYAILDNVMARERVQALAGEFDRGHAGYYDDKPSGEFMEVGNKNLMIRSTCRASSAIPLLFVYPSMLTLARQALSTERYQAGILVDVHPVLPRKR